MEKYIEVGGFVSDGGRKLKCVKRLGDCDQSACELSRNEGICLSLKCANLDREDGERVMFIEEEETTMIKVKAGVDKTYQENGVTVEWKHGKDYLKYNDYSKIYFDNNNGIDVNISIGSKFTPMDKAKEILKVLGVEIIETESIETLEGLEIFCKDNNLYRKGDSFVYINDNKEIEILNIEDIETKFDIELTVLKGE